MTRFMRALSIYPKLVMAFLLVIIPLYLSGLIMNQSGQEVVQKQISESMASRVHFYLTSLETELTRLTRLKLEYVNDDDLLLLATVPDQLNDYERIRALLSAKNKLYLLKSSSPFVENVKLYIPSMDRSINANNFDSAMPPEELEELLNPAHMKSPIFGLGEKLLMSGVYPDAVYAGRPPVLAIEIQLSRPEILRALSSMAEGEGGGAVWMDTGGQWQIASGVEDSLLAALGEGLQGELLNEGGTSGQYRLESEGIDYFGASEYSPLLGTTLAVFVPAETVLEPLSKHRRWIWGVSLIALLLVVVFSYWIYRFIHKPMRRLITSFRRVERGDLSVRLYHGNQDEFNYVYNHFNHMLERIQELIHEVYEQRIRSQQSELKQLQSQINPHFFYNTFFILQGLVRMREFEVADRMLRHLSGYFQFITRNGAEQVSLLAEMKHAWSYVEIQNIRFSGTVISELEPIPQGWESSMVPRLIVQPLIENAYAYGLENKLAGGILRVSFREEGTDRLVIGVEDNGEALDDGKLEALRRTLTLAEEAMETTGVLNVHRRLQLKYGPEFGIEVSRSELGGLKVLLSMRREEGEQP
ncbi:histidine kinase [Paenibacillus sp. FSL H3-0469]|uniref:sensor histidine kinase n=1 Tax=Paenibacillus sp. FSL H3-0469 TaxID=2954506 RepID=UPI0031010147